MLNPYGNPYLLARRNHTPLGCSQHQLARMRCPRRHCTPCPGATGRTSIPPDDIRTGVHFCCRTVNPMSPQCGMSFRFTQPEYQWSSSPHLYDLKALDRELPPGLTRILVVSVQGEVKEILALSESTRAVNRTRGPRRMPSRSGTIFSANLQSPKFRFRWLMCGP